MTPAPPGSMPSIYRFLALSIRYPERSWVGDQYLVWLFCLLTKTGLPEEAGILYRKLACGNWLEGLQVEHTRLFINRMSDRPTPPSGSVDLSGTLSGPSAEHSRSCYRERGHELAAGDEMPDSPERELEFLALLSEEGQPGEKELFLRRHFRPWFARFKAMVEEEARHPFYPAVMKTNDFFTRRIFDLVFSSERQSLWRQLHLGTRRLKTAGQAGCLGLLGLGTTQLSQPVNTWCRTLPSSSTV